MGENNVHATTWCCIDQGHSAIKCYFETNTYVPGEHARIISEIDNTNCRLAIKEIKASLWKTLKLCSHHGREHRVREMVAETCLPGIAAGENRTGDRKLLHSL